MDDALPYLLGAGTTLIVQAVLQLYVVPASDLRGRREDRWEQAVVDLADRLTEEAARLAGAALRRSCDAASDFAQGDRDAAVRSVRDLQHFADYRVRVLADRIISPAPEDSQIRDFTRALHEYRGHVAALSAHVRPESSGRPMGTYYEIQRVGMELSAGQKELFDQTRRLIRGRPPRPRPWFIRKLQRA